jgi:hypothetical protein
VDSDGLSGGVGLFWSSAVTVDIKSSNLHHIDAVVQCKDGSVPPWHFTGFYGESRRENKHLSWTLMRRLHQLRDLPWLCSGDFNETLYSCEHFSEHDREEWQMRAFREVTEDCGLQDLGFSGLPYTWDNRQEGSSNVKARIDRAFGNAALLNMFQVVKVKHISVVQSDHCMIHTELRKHINHRPLGRKAFKYENVWQTHGDYDKVVVDLWRKAERGVGLKGFSKTLASLQSGLSSWGTTTFGDFKKKLSNLRRELDRVRRISVGRGPSLEEKRIMESINEVLIQEEIWIKQRSRVNWLKSGDRNTAYFHAFASQRKRINSISTLQREDGSWCDDVEEIKEEVQGFYKNLYTSEGAPEMQGLLDLVNEKVLQEDKANMDAEFTEEEVKKALFQMHPSKAPGVDGFTAGFYQRHWELVGPELCAAVIGFLNGGDMPEEINDTAITLIPKVRNPQSIKQYRPISLCTVLYKIATKCVANRMRPVLDYTISQEQSAFVPGRLISDNALVAFECVHAMKRKKKGKRVIVQ